MHETKYVPRESRKNIDWPIRVDQFGFVDVGSASLTVLMDIRDELRRLNATISACKFFERMHDIKLPEAPKKKK